MRDQHHQHRFRESTSPCSKQYSTHFILHSEHLATPCIHTRVLTKWANKLFFRFRCFSLRSFLASPLLWKFHLWTSSSAWVKILFTLPTRLPISTCKYRHWSFVITAHPLVFFALYISFTKVYVPLTTINIIITHIKYRTVTIHHL